MGAFKDKENRTWDIRVDVDAVRRVRSGLQIDLLDVLSERGLGAGAAGATHVCLVAIGTTGQGTVAITHAPDGVNFTDAVASGVSIARTTGIAHVELCYALGTPLTASSKIRVTTTGICRIGYVIAYWENREPNDDEACFVPYAQTTPMGLDDDAALEFAVNLNPGGAGFKHVGGYTHAQSVGGVDAKLPYAAEHATVETFKRYVGGDQEAVAFAGGYLIGAAEFKQAGNVYHSVGHESVAAASLTWTFPLAGGMKFAVTLTMSEACAVGASYVGGVSRPAAECTIKCDVGGPVAWTAGLANQIPLAGSAGISRFDVSDDSETIPFVARVAKDAYALGAVTNNALSVYGTLGVNYKAWFSPSDPLSTNVAMNAGGVVSLAATWTFRAPATVRRRGAKLMRRRRLLEN